MSVALNKGHLKGGYEKSIISRELRGVKRTHLYYMNDMFNVTAFTLSLKTINCLNLFLQMTIDTLGISYEVKDISLTKHLLAVELNMPC